MSTSTLVLAARIAARELRGGLRGFYIFLACIAIGVAAIAGVNSVSKALTDAISQEGRAILGGDLSFSLIHREADAAEYAYLQSLGAVSTAATMRGMARRSDGADQALVEIKAVDSLYPLVGLLETAGQDDPSASLAETANRNGSIVAPELLERLGLALGDTVEIGSAALDIRAKLKTEPDRLSSGIGFGPRLLVSLDGLRETGLIRPGSLITWHYRLALSGDHSEAGLRSLIREARDKFPEAGWRIRSRANASPGLASNIRRFAQFLTLVGLTALVVGGVGVANAISSFVDLKRPAIATLKCLGASRGLVFRIYFLQILYLTVIGIGLGLAIGAALPFVAKWLLADLLPIGTAPNFYPLQLLLAAVYGLLVAVGFGLGPLGRARDIPATGLFADRALPAAIRPRTRDRLAQILVLSALSVMAVFLAADSILALWFVGAVVAVFLILRLVSQGIMLLARHAGSVRGTTLRMAIRNIHRPGALTASVVLSLGLGLTLLVTLAQIDTNLRGQLTGTIAEKAPDFFFVDIQDFEKEPFAALLGEMAPDAEFKRVPMLRGRFSKIDGIPAAEYVPAEGARWALRGDRGLTYSSSLPEHSRLISGNWWPADYDGPPLVSLEQEIAEGFGLEIGDTLAVNVLGREVTAEIANIRTLEWESLAINFIMVFSPNTFAGAPHAHLATLALNVSGDDQTESRILSAVTKSYPGITSVRVADAINSVNTIVADLALAVRAAASLALVVSMLVLGGALAAGHRQRRQDAVTLKALGATRKRLMSAFALEYGLLGLATAIFAIAAGSTGSWYVVDRIMEIEFVFYPGVAAAALTIALAVTLGLGLAGTWRILSVKAATYLRNM